MKTATVTADDSVLPFHFVIISATRTNRVCASYAVLCVQRSTENSLISHVKTVYWQRDTIRYVPTYNFMFAILILIDLRISFIIID